MKPQIAKFLSDGTELPFTVMKHVDRGFSRSVTYFISAYDNQRNTWRLNIEIGWAEDVDGPLTVRVETMKGNRYLNSSPRMEGFSYEGLKDFKKYVKPDTVKAFQAAASGDYGKELEQIKQYAEELVSEAEEALVQAKEVKRLVSEDPVNNARSIRMLQPYAHGSGFRLINELLETIKRGK